MSTWTEALPALREGLLRFLQHQMPCADELEVADLAWIPGGNAREAWSFDLHWTENGRGYERGCVMLRKRDAGQLETDLAREYYTMKAVGGTDVPVPPVLWLDDDGAWLERPFYIMERVPGTVDRARLMDPEMGDASRRIAKHFVEVAARLHSVDWQKLGLDCLGAPSPITAAADQITYWEALFLKHRMEPHPIVSEAFRWLKAHQPIAPRVGIVHGDYRYGNFLYEGDRITSLLDWEMTHLGDPAEDIAWAFRPDWSPEHFISLEDYLRLYAEVSAVPVDRERLAFYRLFSEVKFSIISLTGARSFRDGRTRNVLLADRASLVTRNMIRFMEWLSDLEPEGEL